MDPLDYCSCDMRLGVICLSSKHVYCYNPEVFLHCITVLSLHVSLMSKVRSQLFVEYKGTPVFGKMPWHTKECENLLLLLWTLNGDMCRRRNQAKKGNIFSVEAAGTRWLCQERHLQGWLSNINKFQCMKVWDVCCVMLVDLLKWCFKRSYNFELLDLERL